MSEFQPHMTVNTAVNVVAAIVDGGRSEKVLDIFRKQHVMLSFVTMCHGTARTETLDLLGLGESPKEMVMSLVSERQTMPLLLSLGRTLQMRYPGHGIAFSVPINSIGVRVHKSIIQMDNAEEEYPVEERFSNQGYAVVAAVINHGYTNVVMDAARANGAFGGTVINARGCAAKEVKQFLGIEIQEEKEIVLLVVKNDEKQKIMTAIMKAAGLRTESRGVVFSLPVSHAIGLAD